MKRFLTVAILFGAAGLAGAAPGPFTNVGDYGYMWWQNGVAGAIYAIKTSHYAMAFNVTNFGVVALYPLNHAPAESAALTESSEASFSASPPVTFDCRVMANGSTNAIGAFSADGREAQLVECGKFFQRRWHKISVAGGLALDTNQSGLEVAVWPDRISLVLRVVPTTDITNGRLEMTLGLTNLHGAWLTNDPGNALQGPDGSGFGFFKSTGSSTLRVNSHDGIATAQTTSGTWKAGQECSVGLIIYPSANQTASVLKAATATELSPLAVTATEVEPGTTNLNVTYDMDRGWYDIQLRNDKAHTADSILRTHLHIANSTAESRVMRLNFDGVPFDIPGMTAVLRDAELNPLGIPVQLSKDWHTSTQDRWRGTWFHGLTMLTVPARTTFDCELVMAGQNWGGLPAATHSQLSVIGYGGNQQWDEAALGSHGEALTYDIDHVLTDNDCADSRPMLTTNDRGGHDAWGANSGGASFLRYVDGEGKARRHIGMRTRYKRYCPNLTEVIFAGQTDDGTMEFSNSATLFRSDDYTRGFHHFHMDVKADTRFSRLVFFQEAGDTYHYNRGTNYACGDASSLTPLRKWTATFNQRGYIGTPMALTGPMPWVESLDCPTEKGYSAGDYGFVIRSWRARINGKNNVPPYLVERSVANGSILDIVPPPGVTSLKAGDFVEAEIVRFYFSQAASNYYGPNSNFKTALSNYQNTYKLGLREAVGNNIKVKVRRGSLEHLYPLQIRTTKDRAEFTVTGGLGFVPITFTGLSGYRHPVLEERLAGVWKNITQAVHGNDFWQCDYNAEAGSWEITFNASLDTAYYQDVEALMAAPQSRTCRFRLATPRETIR